ncbi:hypothetical protein ADUPG1_006860 [Aduncisulcus paluster]|uniref:Uncharacterized protein n=1 Tax=Aduncisulcus paluster TaxID=2918883 RepID=A0ABQ5KJU4_9EUKA|nr:hypothetical protein ADUPG1_006860 [Aduncisulcus paluster]
MHSSSKENRTHNYEKTLTFISKVSIRRLGWRTFHSRLSSLKQKMVIGSWKASSLESASPYYFNRPILKRLLHAFPQLSSIRCRSLTYCRPFPASSSLFQAQNTQIHLLGGCPELMPQYRQRHHDIRTLLTTELRTYLPEHSIREEVTYREDQRVDILIEDGDSSFWLDVSVMHGDDNPVLLRETSP